ncbi:ThiF family adenylyltransferase [Niabella ginsengisoli]|uniref:ThiF family adenylyltransferase n=1 Tax=Niabella ginsengisoli TaxID=522298 RepID=A0ABS9SP43_9BACT|nr:ThiF family adenylyltransferase [Niabella ginsengisoli]MCH5600158.1 ThiF family adenylyltransferase [Niabella ginsengisoli]
MLLGYNVGTEYYKGYKPSFYRLQDKGESGKLKELLSQTPAIQIYDTIESQLSELAKINNPQKQLTSNEVTDFINEYRNGAPLDECGVWVYYPWSQKLVHLLDEEDFIQVRTSRNNYKIKPEELQILRKKKIGIIGLSVGQSIALTIATERVCNELHLADFDTVELANMNRLSNCNVYNLGASKAIITAQKIAELDPYLIVTCFSEGITESNIDAFLGEGSTQLDILVEECDSIDVKILSRIKAREKKIPVVMDTNDRGMLDVERFDLEPERPIFHGNLKEDIDLTRLKDLTNKEKLPMLDAMVNLSALSERMKYSLSEMGKSINTWPQLASSVMLGGAMVTDTCRRILLSETTSSGRYYIDFSELIK